MRSDTTKLKEAAFCCALLPTERRAAPADAHWNMETRRNLLRLRIQYRGCLLSPNLMYRCGTGLHNVITTNEIVVPLFEHS